MGRAAPLWADPRGCYRTGFATHESEPSREETGPGGVWRRCAGDGSDGGRAGWVRQAAHFRRIANILKEAKRGMVFRGDRKIDVLKFDDPIPKHGEVVIEMKASGMCGSDLHFYRNKPSEVIKSLGFKDLASRGIDPDSPIIGGHEPCGVIAEVGPGVDRNLFKVGDRVLVFHYEGCRTCDHCRSGWTQMCDQGALINGVIIPTGSRRLHACLHRLAGCDA